MADGSLKLIRDIVIGDLVQTLQGARRVLFAGNRRLEDCVSATVRDSSGLCVGTQIHSETHAVLTPDGWTSYRDAVSRRQRAEKSTLYGCQGKSDESSESSAQTSGRLSSVEIEIVLHAPSLLYLGGSDPVGVLQLGDVGRRTRNHSPLDGRGKAKIYSRCKLRYVHPYRDVELTAEEDTSFGSCEMVPCGKLWVVDLTIEDANHYITEIGLVNKNCFDELTHFSESQFWYLLSRNRSRSGVRPYVRATCNPAADSWVAKLIAWWIDRDTGLPIAERGGKLRWFTRINDELVWADTPDALKAQYPEAAPKSLTFIPSKLTDNPILMAADPGYRANLLALPMVERERLLSGNWKIRPAAGLYFQRSWCEVVQPNEVPAGLQIRRGWDLAATPESTGNDPDWTTATKIGRSRDGRYFVISHFADRGTPGDVKRWIMNLASSDGKDVEQWLPRDPAQAGKWQAADMAKALDGYIARFAPASGDKLTSFGPFSAQAEAGNVTVVAGPWNERWFSELEAFGPDAKHDDDADSTSMAYNSFQIANKGDNVLEYFRRRAEEMKPSDPERL